MSWLALWLYAGWTLLLLGVLVSMRAYLTTTRQRAPNNFSTSGEDVSPFSGRLCRAHANCYENLPLFAAFILVATATGNADITDTTALLVVGARIGQSLTHLSSTSNKAVMVRFTFFVTQLALLAYWFIALGLRLV